MAQIRWLFSVEETAAMCAVGVVVDGEERIDVRAIGMDENGDYVLEVLEHPGEIRSGTRHVRAATAAILWGHPPCQTCLYPRRFVGL